MSFEMALVWMKQGKKIRRRAWCPGVFAEIEKSASGMLSVNTNGLIFHRNDILADDWEVME